MHTEKLGIFVSYFRLTWRKTGPRKEKNMAEFSSSQNINPSSPHIHSSSLAHIKALEHKGQMPTLSIPSLYPTMVALFPTFYDRPFMSNNCRRLLKKNVLDFFHPAEKQRLELHNSIVFINNLLNLVAYASDMYAEDQTDVPIPIWNQMNIVIMSYQVDGVITY